jgi:hypothetical protein
MHGALSYKTAQVSVVEGMTIKALSEVTGVRLVDVIKTLIKMGEEPKTISDALKGVHTSVYLLYLYKSTNTDT